MMAACRSCLCYGKEGKKGGFFSCFSCLSHAHETLPKVQQETQLADNRCNDHRRRARALPSLQKVTVKCACGRKVSHLALPQGVAAKALRCDAECERQQRSSRLADAFGIDDPSHHVPYVDRQRWARSSHQCHTHMWASHKCGHRCSQQMCRHVHVVAKHHEMPMGGGTQAARHT